MQSRHSGAVFEVMYGKACLQDTKASTYVLDKELVCIIPRQRPPVALDVDRFSYTVYCYDFDEYYLVYVTPTSKGHASALIA